MEQNAIPVKQYIRNPDVVLREEDEDGGLLFNPDTSQVKIINPTGLVIWKKCENPSEPNKLAQAIRQEFEDFPEDKLLADIQEFLDGMVQSGFIGVLESS